MDVCGDFFALSMASSWEVDDCSKWCSVISLKKVCEGNCDFENLVEMKKGADGQMARFLHVFRLKTSTFTAQSGTRSVS